MRVSARYAFQPLRKRAYPFQQKDLPHALSRVVKFFRSAIINAVPLLVVQRRRVDHRERKKVSVQCAPIRSASLWPESPEYHQWLAPRCLSHVLHEQSSLFAERYERLCPNSVNFTALHRSAGGRRGCPIRIITRSAQTVPSVSGEQSRKTSQPAASAFTDGCNAVRYSNRVVDLQGLERCKAEQQPRHTLCKGLAPAPTCWAHTGRSPAPL